MERQKVWTSQTRFGKKKKGQGKEMGGGKGTGSVPTGFRTGIINKGYLNWSDAGSKEHKTTTEPTL